MTKKTYEEDLFQKLSKLPNGVWFKIHDRPDVVKFTAAVKYFIDMKNDFELSDDMRNIRRVGSSYHELKELPQCCTVEVIEPGYVETITMPKGQVFNLVHTKRSYRTYFNGKLISIAS